MSIQNSIHKMLNYGIKVYEDFSGLCEMYMASMVYRFFKHWENIVVET